MPLAPAPVTRESLLSPNRWPARAFAVLPTVYLIGGYVLAVLIGEAFVALIVHADPTLRFALNAKRMTSGILWADFASLLPVAVITLIGLPPVACRSLAQLGVAPPSLRNVGAGVIGALVMLAAVAVASQLQNLLTGVESHEKIVDMLEGITSQGLLVGFVATACIFHPIVEELIYRGFVFNALLRLAARVSGRTLGIAPLPHAVPLSAAVLSALLFSASHVEWTAFFPLACGGLVLALVYYRTGSLVSSMITHALFNAAGVVAALTVHSHGG